MTDIFRLRLNLLRACYLLLVLGLSLNFWPLVLSGAAALPLTEGVVNAILSTVGVLAILGLVAPLRMLPLLLFEIAWKLVWTISVALPNALASTLDTAMAKRFCLRPGRSLCLHFALAIHLHCLSTPVTLIHRAPLSNPDTLPHNAGARVHVLIQLIHCNTFPFPSARTGLPLRAL